MNCNQCASELEPGAAFCAKCGAPANQKLQAKAPELASVSATDERVTRPCPYCGEQILVAAIKCRFCGSTLTGGTLQQQAPGGITLNAPAATSAGNGAAGVPNIVIQNVQSTQAPMRPAVYKNPALALLFSAIFPGGGQFYNGHAGKGILVFFTWWLVLPYIWSLFDAYSSAQRINRVGF